MSGPAITARAFLCPVLLPVPLRRLGRRKTRLVPAAPAVRSRRHRWVSGIGAARRRRVRDERDIDDAGTVLLLQSVLVLRLLAPWQERLRKLSASHSGGMRMAARNASSAVNPVLVLQLHGPALGIVHSGQVVC